MNTENLKEFIVLAETKNFWEASERLYMNQSTLSKHIKSLFLTQFYRNPNCL